jgi:hypothetical protein
VRVPPLKVDSVTELNDLIRRHERLI